MCRYVDTVILYHIINIFGRFTGFNALEIFWILLGWFFIFTRPGIAALRCLRSLHVVWNAAQFGFKGRGKGALYLYII